MSMKKIWAAVVVSFLAISIVNCGTGTHKRLVFRPASYQEMLAFPSTGDPLDVEKLVAEYPELKGKVVTAPQYIEEYKDILKKGVAPIKFLISPGASLLIDIVTLDGHSENGYPKTFVVGPHGYIDVPFIRKVEVANRTVDEVKEEMEKKFAKYIKSPQVIINSNPYYGGWGPWGQPYGGGAATAVSTGSSSFTSDIIVLGVVWSSSGYRGWSNIPYTGKETIVNVLGITGLPSNAEWRQIRVIRRIGNTPEEKLLKSRIIICDLWNYFALGDVRQDIPLMPGDVVFVPPKLSVKDQFDRDWDDIIRYASGSITLSNFNDEIIRRILKRQ